MLGTAEGGGRPWWRPTLVVVVVFSGGLWVGATLSFADTASAAGLLIGVAGLALGGARLLSNKLRADRLRAIRARKAMDGAGLSEDEVSGPDR